MGTLVVSSKPTVVDGIALGRRIWEIMKHKGASYSIVAMSARLKIGRETFRMMLNGKRDIFTFELDKIAKDLKIPIDRILQEDVRTDVAVLSELLANQSSLEKALEISQKLVEVSIGFTERCNALNQLARVYFYLENYDQSYRIWTEAFQIAEDISKQFEDKTQYYNIICNLISYFTTRREYTHLSELLQNVGGAFDGEPVKRATIYHANAMIYTNGGNVELAREYLQKTLQCFLQTGYDNEIGRAKLKLGYLEYFNKNYFRARLLLEEAISHLQSDDRMTAIAIMGCAKTLIKLDKKEEATSLLLDTIDRFVNHDLIGNYHLLLSIVQENPHTAERALGLDISSKVRGLIIRHLMHHYYKIGDSESLMRYYGIAESQNVISSDVLEGDHLFREELFQL